MQAFTNNQLKTKTTATPALNDNIGSKSSKEAKKEFRQFVKLQLQNSTSKEQKKAFKNKIKDLKELIKKDNVPWGSREYYLLFNKVFSMTPILSSDEPVIKMPIEEEEKVSLTSIEDPDNDFFEVSPHLIFESKDDGIDENVLIQIINSLRGSLKEIPEFLEGTPKLVKATFFDEEKNKRLTSKKIKEEQFKQGNPFLVSRLDENPFVVSVKVFEIGNMDIEIGGLVRFSPLENSTLMSYGFTLKWNINR